MGKTEKKHSKKKIIVTVILILFILCVLFMLGALAVVDHYLGKINRTQSEVVDVIPPEKEDFETDERPEDKMELDPDEVEWGEAVSPGDDHLINILLVGQDRREGEGRQRSDSMILCSINTETNEVSMISFLRDLYVQIPGGYADNRLNATYAFGGFPLLNATLTKNFGISIDGNVEVDFSRFVDVIEAVGGVDINLSAAEANIVLKNEAEGYYHLDGEQALTYARIRYIDSDFNRTQRQRNVLTAVFNKVKSMSLNDMLSVLDSILPSLTTDMTNTEIIATATKLFPLLQNAEFESYRIPADNAYYGAYISGMSVLVPDIEENCRLLKEEYLPLG